MGAAVVLGATMLNEKFDALRPPGVDPNWLLKIGFEPVEESDGVRWMWATGPEASLEIGRLPHGVRAVIEGRLPDWQKGVAVYGNGRLLAEWNTPGPHKVQFSILADELPFRILFRHLTWNRTDGAGVLPEDLRALAFVLSRAEFEPTVETKGRICPYPFSRMEVPGEPFVPCCKSWLTDEYHALPGPGWNGEGAQKLRASVMDGSYRYCRLETCGTQLWPRDRIRKLAREQAGDFPFSEEALCAVEAENPVIPGGPGAVTVMADPRCNLACPSCREGKITDLSPVDARAVERADQTLYQYSTTIKTLKVAGDGDALFSPFLRSLITDAPRRFPRLETIDLLTNGLLLTEAGWNALGESRTRIRRVSVSVDAGDAPTYARVRGGNWELLGENLRFLAGLRRKGEIDFLGLNFTVRSENFRTLRAFMRLAADLKVDEVYLSRLNDWAPRMKIDFAAEAVHLREHPFHEEFRREWVALGLYGVKIRTNLPADVFPLVGRTFCPLPFGQLFLSELGEPYACCYGLDGPPPQTDSGGNALRIRSREELTSAWNSEFMRGLRRSLWSGERPSYCSRCFLHEEMGMQSLRQAQLARLDADLGILALSMDAEGNVPLRFVSSDLRFGNNCNLMCRMCGPKSSRKLVDEYSRIWPKESYEEYRNTDWYRAPWLKELIMENAGVLREMHFAGGEPFLIPEVMELLSEMTGRGHAREIALSFNTNLTVLPEEIKELLPEFRSTRLLGSLDGVGQWNELIRWPSKFSVVEKNLRELDRLAPELRLDVLVLHTTVQISNVLLLPEIVAFCQSFDHLLPFPLLGLLRGPDHLSIRVLSVTQKWAVERRLRRWLDTERPRWMALEESRGQRGHAARFESWVLGVIGFMWSADESRRWPEFVRISRLQDEMRGCDLTVRTIQALEEAERGERASWDPAREPGPEAAAVRKGMEAERDTTLGRLRGYPQ